MTGRVAEMLTGHILFCPDLEVRCHCPKYRGGCRGRPHHGPLPPEPDSRAALWQDDIDNDVDGAEEKLYEAIKAGMPANAFSTDKWAKQISEGAQSFLQDCL